MLYRAAWVPLSLACQLWPPSVVREDFPRITDDHGFVGREGLHVKKFIRQW